MVSLEQVREGRDRECEDGRNRGDGAKSSSVVLAARASSGGCRGCLGKEVGALRRNEDVTELARNNEGDTVRPSETSLRR